MQRMGDLEALPSVSAVQANLAGRVRERLTVFLASAVEDFTRATQALEVRRIAMTEAHRAAGHHLQTLHDERHTEEARQRAARFRKGLPGIWDRVTGQHGKL